MYPIIGLVGPSGSGKSTLIKEMIELFPELKIAKSLTTRPKRGEEDELFYDFITPDELKKLNQHKRLTHVSEYADNYYSNDIEYLNNLLSNFYGIAALVESGVEYLRKAGYQVHVIKITPQGYVVSTDVKRQIDDQLRTKKDVSPILNIENSFEPGGKEKSIETLANFINSLLC